MEKSKDNYMGVREIYGKSIKMNGIIYKMAGPVLSGTVRYCPIWSDIAKTYTSHDHSLTVLLTLESCSSRVTVSISGGKVTTKSAYNTLFEHHGVGYATLGSLFNWWFRVATSPNEFVLVKMKVKNSKNLREVVTAKNSAYARTSGIDPKASIPFNIETIGNNKFKVVPETLEPGEYCFIYQGTVPTGRRNQSVFDFSIK